uniref:Uncharacterized protein n=1 Tax=Acrobeloides nanus TaxID=290746 RepID=A0A914EFL3_9BILA
MSDSGQPSAFDEYDLHLSSLTVGEFKQEIEINGRVLQWFIVKVRIEMNEQMTLEDFINNAILAENQARRIRSTSPVRENGAFTLMVNVCTPGVNENEVKVVEDLRIEYTPAHDFVYRRH